MIEEAYVSFDVAKLLKAKGFDQSTFAKYANGDVVESWYNDYRERMVRFEHETGTFLEPNNEPQYDIIGVR